MSLVLITLLCCFVVLLVLTVPVAFSIGIASLVGLFVKGTIPLQAIPQRIFVSLDSFTLLAVPFFIVAGDIMMRGGISKRLVELSRVLLGWTVGSMAYVTFFASALFGAISGSAVATTAAIGGLMYPEMLKAKYDSAFASAVGAVGGTLGILIPPSIALLIFGTQTGTSVGDLFLVGGVSGIIATVGYILTAMLVLRKEKAQGTQAPFPTLRDVGKAVGEAFWGLLSPVIILGGIYTGWFTPTEAAVIAIVYSLIICCFVYKELDLKGIIQAMGSAALTSGMVLLLVGTASLFSWVLTIENVTRVINNLIQSANITQLTFLLTVNIILLIFGMLMETIPVILLTAPILFPVAMSFGVNPVHFGVIVVFNLAFGLFTPPFGMCVFVSQTYSKQPITRIFSQCRYFLLTGLLMIILITYCPGLIMWIL